VGERHWPFFPRKLPRTLTLPKTSLWYNLEVSATRFPDRAAMLFYEGLTTYAQFKQQAEWLAGFLQRECGVKRGDRVALFLQNCPQFVIAYYAILRADAVVVPINCMNLSAELEHILRDSGATIVVAAQDLFPRVQPLLGNVIRHAVIACYADYIGRAPQEAPPESISAPRLSFNAPEVSLWSDALARRVAPAAHESTAEDLCVLAYTSGSTGTPKGCAHRHRGVLHTALGTTHWNEGRQDACTLSVLPMFHVTGMQNSMNAPIYAGGTMVLLPRWNRDVAANLIRRYGVTNLTLVPAMVVDLISSPDIDNYDLSSLRVLGGGGAAMPEAVARKLKEKCGLTYLEGYGLTETLAPSHANPGDRPKTQCLGIPIFDTDARIIDPETLVEVPQGTVGEIVVHGPQVLDEYWNNPAENAAAFITLGGKRFLRTGDLGRVDEEGYFFFVDRLKRMINAAGFKVWPAEIESLLYGHPSVQEACVIGTADARSGERVKALIVPKAAMRATVTAEHVMAWARDHMSAYKVPREIEFVDTLPRSASGKIDWRLLQERERGKHS
jgi:fatty-acyl-CoA synthase